MMSNQKERALEKIAEMQKEMDWIDFIEKLIPNVDFTVLSPNRNTFITIKPERDQVQDIIKALSPTGKVEVYKGGGSQNYEIDTPFALKIDNNVYGKSEIKLDFYSAHEMNGEKFHVWLKCPIDWFIEETHVEQRGVTDSELHYFAGESFTAIRKKRIRKRTWIHKKQGYYGGDSLLVDAEEANRIVSGL